MNLHFGEVELSFGHIKSGWKLRHAQIGPLGAAFELEVGQDFDCKFRYFRSFRFYCQRGVRRCDADISSVQHDVGGDRFRCSGFHLDIRQFHFNVGFP